MKNAFIILRGNLCADPDLRYTASGTPVTNLRVASTPRRFDKAKNEWEDGETMFLSCSIWRNAEDVAKAVAKGQQVIVLGNLNARSYVDKNGASKTAWEVEAEQILPVITPNTPPAPPAASGGFTTNEEPFF